MSVEGDDPVEHEESECSDDSVEAIARGRASVLKDVVQESDARFQAAMKSQDTLALSINRLTQVLDKLLEDTPMPFRAQHAARVSGLRKRVQSLTSTLQLVRLRMKNIESSLSNQSPKRRSPQGRHLELGSPLLQSRQLFVGESSKAPEETRGDSQAADSWQMPSLQ